MHLFLAHFPVALLVVGAAADVVGVALRSERIRGFAGVLLMLGGLAALLTFLTGQDALARALSRVSPVNPALEAHTQWGGAGVWVLVGGAVLRGLWRDSLDGARGWLLLAAAVASAALVVAISVSGTAIAHGG